MQSPHWRCLPWTSILRCNIYITVPICAVELTLADCCPSILQPYAQKKLVVCSMCLFAFNYHTRFHLPLASSLLHTPGSVHVLLFSVSTPRREEGKYLFSHSFISGRLHWSQSQLISDRVHTLERTGQLSIKQQHIETKANTTKILLPARCPLLPVTSPSLPASLSFTDFCLLTFWPPPLQSLFNLVTTHGTRNSVICECHDPWWPLSDLVCQRRMTPKLISDIL